MQLPAMAAWAWVPIVLVAALAQTGRNAAQRNLTRQIGTLPATLVRFLYGLPLAAAWLLLVLILGGLQEMSAQLIQAWSPAYAGWMVLGALSQLLATALLLAAMNERNFVVAVTYSKTDVLQVALFATLFLQEIPGWLSALAMAVATLGVLILSKPGNTTDPAMAAPGWLSRAALYGLGSGAGFALASVGYRGAALALPGISPWLIGACGVLLAQLLQTLLLGGFLLLRQPGALSSIAGAWRLSSVAGALGAMASIGWLTAAALRPAADVRTLGLVEVLFSYLVSSRLFSERLSRSELSGLVLVTAGLALICLQL
jgi:drug/metabolite transporter (DMT)-like permease